MKIFNHNDSVKTTIDKLRIRFENNSLFKNSIYLMLSTAVIALFGFIFWILSARLFTPEQVGIGTTLISVMTLISSFSLLGLGNSLIKYLPTSVKKNEKINTSFVLAGLFSILISAIFLVFLKTFSAQLLFIRQNLFFAIFFILFVIFSSLNSLSESIFIAYRSSKYILIKNTLFSLSKLILPFIFVALGAYGIFMSLGVATTAALALSLVFLITKFNYIFAPAVNMDIVKRMTKFSLGNYLAGFIEGLPAVVLPVIITNSIGARFSAYFYIDMMIANLLYIIPLATSQSLFAEGSHHENELENTAKKALKIIYLILVPAIIITFLFAKYLLRAFGKEYSSEGVVFVQILAVSGIFVSINYLGNALFYINHKIKLVILVNFIGASIILSLSTMLVHLNLLGIGVAWVVGQAIAAILYLILVLKFI